MRRELGRCSRRRWACPVRCHHLGAGPGEKRSGATLASTSANSTHPASVQAPTTDLSSPHAPIIALHCITSRSLSADSITTISKPSENTSIIHIAVAVAAPSGHWEEIRRPRPLSPTAARDEETHGIL